MSLSNRIGWIKQKPDDNCQITRIGTKSFFDLPASKISIYSFVNKGQMPTLEKVIHQIVHIFQLAPVF